MESKQLEFGGFPAAPVSLRILRETPAARIIGAGPTSASLLELIAAVLNGNADLALQILARYPTAEALHRAPQSELRGIKGMSDVRTAAVMAALELGRRASLGDPTDRPRIDSCLSAAQLVLGEMSALEQEELRVILLDRRNRLIEIVTVYRGSMIGMTIRVGDIFREAVRRNADGLIVVHSHPSGDPTPSPDDIDTTRSIIEAGQLFGIDVMDHLIIGHGQRFVSLKERGLAFSDR